MSQTVLDVLWRPLNTLFRVVAPDAPEPRRDGDGTAGTDESESLAADGGSVGRDEEHLRDLPDGAGCAEIWEHLSERQAAEAQADD